tara:strand:+ start:1373 stop:1873 length:501 start_codon:yes stop_codon:yes gene_type:complete
MSKSKSTAPKNFLRSYGPMIILIVSVLNQLDLNYLNLNFSFNFAYIFIFYWSLKKPEHLPFGFIFICGIFNDVVTSFPIGLSSLNYLIICVVATYIRNITLRPIFINDWLLFLVTILLVNSINFLVLEIFMNIDINFNVYITNLGFTFLFYPAFYGLFKSLIKFLY